MCPAYPIPPRCLPIGLHRVRPGGARRPIPKPRQFALDRTGRPRSHYLRGVSGKRLRLPASGEPGALTRGRALAGWCIRVGMGGWGLLGGMGGRKGRAGKGGLFLRCPGHVPGLSRDIIATVPGQCTLTALLFARCGSLRFYCGGGISCTILGVLNRAHCDQDGLKWRSCIGHRFHEVGHHHSGCTSISSPGVSL